MSTYRNGNYLVTIDPDGTKLYTGLRRGEEFSPEFPDAIDIKLTNTCYHGCTFCHEDSGPEGKEGNLGELKQILSYLPQVPIELSFGGGNILTIEKEKLIDLFKWCKERGHKVGITLNYIDWISFLSYGKNYTGLIDAVGVSVNTIGSEMNNREECLKLYNSHLNDWMDKVGIPVVYHFVLGTFSIDFLKSFLSEKKISILGNGKSKFNFKRVLLLGYKLRGRGESKTYYPSSDYLEKLRTFLLQSSMSYGFNDLNIISLDNLAITQLRMKEAFTSEEWEELYQGDDFTHSMYIDLPGRSYGPSSTSSTRIEFDNLKYKNNIVEYFKNEHN